MGRHSINALPPRLFHGKSWGYEWFRLGRKLIVHLQFCYFLFRKVEIFLLNSTYFYIVRTITSSFDVWRLVSTDFGLLQSFLGIVSIFHGKSSTDLAKLSGEVHHCREGVIPLITLGFITPIVSSPLFSSDKILANSFYFHSLLYCIDYK